MVKLRSARYCNLKLFLLYLVVYGHWIESGIQDYDVLRIQYRLIYLVHMPLFAFLTGLFVHTREDCLRQIRRMFPIYLVAQTAAILFGGGAVTPLTPFWHLWYLLSACFWMGAAWILLRLERGKVGILVISVIAGCLAGEMPWLNRILSGSRTVVFFPYFWAGVLCRQDIPWHNYRGFGTAALIAGVTVVGVVGKQIPVTFLYQASPYGGLEHGVFLRLVCYLLGALLGFFLLTAVPERRFPWTRAGADTMPVYLLHAPIVLVLRDIKPNWALCPIYAGTLIYILDKILQWNRPLYGIISEERRDSLWRRLKKSTSNMDGRSTGSFCP